MNAVEPLPWFQVMQDKVAKMQPRTGRAKDWSDALVAVHFRIIYFAYHRDEYARLVADGLAHVPESDHDRELIAAAFGEQDAQQLSINAVLASAHLLAAAQSLHAACELFVRLTYFSLGLDTTALSLSLKNLNIQDVVKHSFGKSKTKLEALKDSAEYHYLADFVSVNKYRHLLSALPVLSDDGGVEHAGLSVAAFEIAHGAATQTYPSKWATDFLSLECESTVDRLNDIGSALATDCV